MNWKQLQHFNRPPSRLAVRGMRCLALLLLAGLFTNCGVFQTITDPVERILRKGSCISVDVPPITLTPARTAAERQLIGEETEVEEDGWLIASSRNARRYAGENVDVAEGVPPARRRKQIEEGVLAFYSEPVRIYRGARILGEGIDGRLHIVPASVSPRQGSYQNPEEIDIAGRIASEVNRSRAWLLDNYASEGHSEAEVEEYRRRYYETAQSGEWVLNEESRWVRVR